MATQIFEGDKLSYVVDFTQLQVEAVGERVNGHLEQVIFESKSLWASFNTEKGSLSVLGQNYLEDNEQLLALGIIFPNNTENNIFLPKMGLSKDLKLSIEESRTFQGETRLQNGISIIRWDVPNKLIFRILIEMKSEDIENKSYLEIFADLTKTIPHQFGQGLLLLVHGKEIYTKVGESNLTHSELQKFVDGVANDSTNKSEFHKIGKEEYLTAIVPVSLGGLKLIYLESRDLVLGALKLLFHRSILFVAMSLFAIIFVVVFSSGALTRNLSILTAASVEVGSGNLDYHIEINSRDEVGVLAKTFQKMIQQIKKLLRETEEKVRMEQELFTASWVQESLFPVLRRFEVGTLRFAGDHMSSSECSGDWWHYFQRGDDLFVIIGDATGHGTSAALVTAASRAVFSHLETTSCSLEEMAESWNRAIIKGSSQKLFMTAQLLQVNSQSGFYKIINLSHELPIRLNNERNAEVENLSVLAPLGRSSNISLKVDEGILMPGHSLILYTDGLYAVEGRDGRKMSERVFFKKISKMNISEMNAENILGGLFSIIKEFRSGESLQDDVAILVVERMI